MPRKWTLPSAQLDFGAGGIFNGAEGRSRVEAGGHPHGFAGSTTRPRTAASSSTSRSSTTAKGVTPPCTTITRSIRAAHIHNRRLRVSVFPGEYQEQTPVRTYIHTARFVPGVLCVVVRRHNLLLWRNMQVTSPGIHSPGDILIMTTFNCIWPTLGHVKA